jgi:hypothetical protein
MKNKKRKSNMPSYIIFTYNLFLQNKKIIKLSKVIDYLAEYKMGQDPFENMLDDICKDFLIKFKL